MQLPAVRLESVRLGIDTVPVPLGVSVMFWFVPPAVIPAAPANVSVVSFIAVGLARFESEAFAPLPPDV